jgi:signal transduction histidine kinase
MSLINLSCMRLQILLLLNCLIWSSAIQAQTPKMHFTHLTKNDGLLSNNVTSILQDSKGFLWFGTSEGLAKYDGYSFQRFIHSNTDTLGLSSNHINCLAEDNNGNLWIGTSQGLNCLNLNTLKFDNSWKDNNDTLVSTSIYSLLFDSTQKFWIGTMQGLFVYDRIKQLFTQLQLPSSEYITALCEDNNNNIWIGTRFGLDVLNQKTGSFKHYFDKERITSILCDNKGALWVAVFYGVNLWYSLSTENVNFVAKEIRQNESYRFSQIIQDKQGNYWLTVRDGGIYFMQQGTNKGVSLKIEILPPFWETWWAYSVYLLIIILLLSIFRYYSLVQFRLKNKIEMERHNAEKLHEIDQIKLKFFANISHEFRTPLTLISGPLNFFLEHQTEKRYEKDQKYYSLMKRNVDRMLHLINKVLDIRKLDSGYMKIYVRNDDIIQFIRSLTDSFNFKAERKKVTYNTIFNQTAYFAWFDPDVLDKIVFNLLSNAFKYTPENGEISLETSIL